MVKTSDLNKMLGGKNVGLLVKTCKEILKTAKDEGSGSIYESRFEAKFLVEYGLLKMVDTNSRGTLYTITDEGREAYERLNKKSRKSNRGYGGSKW